MGETRVRLLDTAEAEARGLHRSWWPLLDAEERTRAARLMDREARLRFVLSHGLLRTTLSEQAAVAPDAWRFGREAQGRPVIAAPAGSGLSFSLSRCPGLAAVMVSRLPGCGIDVDRVGRVQDPLVVARAWFHPPRRRGGGGARGPERDLLFTRLWTLREACAKALGCGLDHLPPDLKIELDGGARVCRGGEPSGWRVEQSHPSREHVLAVVERGSVQGW